MTCAPTVVSSHWLRDQLGDLQTSKAKREIRVLDATFDRDKIIDAYKDCYLKEHIPQSLFFDLHNCVESTPDIPRNLPKSDEFQDYLRSLGIWKNTHIVVYDRFDMSSAFRTWWLFRLYGHKNISVLDGGLGKWTADGYEATQDIPEVDRSDYELGFDSCLIRNFDDIKSNLESKTEQVVDSRLEDDPKMIDIEIDGGIIPGSKLMPYSLLFNEDLTMKTADELKALFNEKDVNLDAPLVTTCNTGMTACMLAAAAHRLGLDVPIYYGSWTEWKNRVPDSLKQRVQ